MAYSFEDFFRDLEGNYQLTESIFPFLLIFVILFAVLQKSRILGEGKKNFNIVVAGIISFMAISPHFTGRGPDIVEPLINILPQVSIITVAVILALLLIGLLGGEARWMGGSLSGFIALLAFAIIIYIFGAEFEWWENLPRRLGWWGSDTSSIVLIILVFAIIVWYITKEPAKDQKAGRFLKSFEDFGNMFKKE